MLSGSGVTICGFQGRPDNCHNRSAPGKWPLRQPRMNSTKAVDESRTATHTFGRALVLCGSPGVSLQSSVSSLLLHSLQLSLVRQGPPVRRADFTRLETRAKESNVCASAKVTNLNTKRKQTVNVSLRYSSQAAHDLL